MRFGAFFVVVFFGSVVLPGQAAPHSPDAARAVREVAEKVRVEMQEIDRLLQEASRPPDTESLLTTAIVSQGEVIRGIDALLEELHNFCPGGT